MLNRNNTLLGARALLIASVLSLIALQLIVVACVRAEDAPILHNALVYGPAENSEQKLFYDFSAINIFHQSDTPVMVSASIWHPTFSHFQSELVWSAEDGSSKNIEALPGYDSSEITKESSYVMFKPTKPGVYNISFYFGTDSERTEYKTKIVVVAGHEESNRKI